MQRVNAVFKKKKKKKKKKKMEGNFFAHSVLCCLSPVMVRTGIGRSTNSG
jgi:hypothetical protein